MVAKYYLSNDGISMSLQAVRIEDAQIVSGTREHLLPLKSSALTGDGPGSDQQFDLMYDKGDDAPKMDAEAVKLDRKAAEQGDPYAKQVLKKFKTE